MRISVMWERARLSSSCKLRWFFSAARPSIIEDEGDWFYASEWWGTDPDGHTVLRSNSDKGNGVVSVVAYPSSRPGVVHWPKTEQWLQQRYAQVHPELENNGQFKILGYQWRVLRFNDTTRQSTVKIMAAYRKTDPGSVYLMQQAHCLAIPYLRSMVSVGLATLASCNYNLRSAIDGKKSMRILCVGHGGGSLPLFLASKILGATIDIVEIDPLVISASIQAMGFPAFARMKSSGERLLPKPTFTDQVLWKGVHERLFLYESDAEKFIVNNCNLYDLVFIDAYDGNDNFPHKLWDPDEPFLEALKSRLHPEHGTVVVNLHSDSDILNPDGSIPSFFEQLFPMGKYVSQVCQAYKDVLTDSGSDFDEGHSGLGFIVSVPWLCNQSLVVCRGVGMDVALDTNLVLHSFTSKCLELENALNLPFSCVQYIKRGFVLIN
ncbi:hypothetical protein NE237_011073 [Protea cynaroides]|uniref:S-adenosyl-L-methionine-dependent methyltransferase superfamily protein n=1 Tax=Protea cynaroides TaxID=273540 RepID=A0A9Q0JXL4_9MAGN|nr:hypothetical protein NE237_011073 [Protea cynaroides]